MRIHAIRRAWLLILLTTDIVIFNDWPAWTKCCKPKVPGKNSDMFHLINESCPYQNWTSVARERCPNPDHFHCLKDDHGRTGWVCREPIWVEKGMLCSKTLRQIYSYTQISLDLILRLNYSLHITVYEMYIIVHFEGFILHKSYLVKHSLGIKATHAIKRKLCCCKIKPTNCLSWNKNVESYKIYNTFHKLFQNKSFIREVS